MVKNMENKESKISKQEKLIDSIIGSLEKDIEEIYDMDDESITPVEEGLFPTEKDNTALVPQNESEEDEPKPDSVLEGDFHTVEPFSPIRRFFVAVSIAMIFFTVIGVINSVMFVGGVVTDIRERRVLKNEFALFVYPVVINDPPAFDSVDNLLDSTVIASAIWKIILTEDKSRYATDFGVIYVPAADVELAARSIFGTGTLAHDTVNLGIQFIYSPQNNHYEIPENPILFSNSPRITEVTNIGESYTVTIDYIAPSPLKVAGIAHDDEPIKTMIYTISRTAERMTINSIEAAEFDRGNL
jgi:hypothetical protein